MHPRMRLQLPLFLFQQEIRHQRHPVFSRRVTVLNIAQDRLYHLVKVCLIINHSILIFKNQLSSPYLIELECSIIIINLIEGPSVPGQNNYRPSGQVFPSPHGAPQGYHGYPPNQQGQPPPGPGQVRKELLRQTCDIRL